MSSSPRVTTPAPDSMGRNGGAASVALPQAAVEHMNENAREHLPDHLQIAEPATADLSGATVNYYYSFAAPPVGAYYEQDLTVGPGIEMAFPAPGLLTSVGYLDLSASSLTITFSQNASFDGIYNAFTLSDNYNEVPEITGVTLTDNGGSSSGLTPGDITHTSDSVTVDLLGTHFAAGGEIALAFTFVDLGQADAGLLQA